MSDDRKPNRFVDFGYESVPEREKTERVREVFDSVATRYDVMNDLMSFGLHRLWKRIAVMAAGAKQGAKILDLAGGTGDLAALLARKVGVEGRVIVADINFEMLNVGRDKNIDRGNGENVAWVQGNAECLPFDDSAFDLVTIAFGLRNVTDKALALTEMRRILRPGGRVLVLEFSKLKIPALHKLYDTYSFSVLPALGNLIADDAASYRYLAESIRMHPDQESLLSLMTDAGFSRCRYRNLAGGIVALHDGWRL